MIALQIILSLQKIILSPLYFPPISYFSAIVSAEEVWLDKEDIYQKQSYKNRCYILSSQKVDRLSIPIIGGNKKLPLNQIALDDSTNWRDVHWRSIQSCYGKSAFFEHYGPAIKELIYHNAPNLAVFNTNILTFCLKALAISKKILTDSAQFPSEKDSFVDLKGLIHPKISHQKQYFFKSVEYYQNFGNKFEPNLSIIDLLMCEGPTAREIIIKSLK